MNVRGSKLLCVVTVLLLQGCVQNTTLEKQQLNPVNEGPKKPVIQEEQKSFTLEGQVTKVMNLIFPSAHANDSTCVSRCDDNRSCIHLNVLRDQAGSHIKVCEANISYDGRYKFVFVPEPPAYLEDSIIKLVATKSDGKKRELVTYFSNEEEKPRLNLNEETSANSANVEQSFFNLITSYGRNYVKQISDTNGVDSLVNMVEASVSQNCSDLNHLQSKSQVKWLKDVAPVGETCLFEIQETRCINGVESTSGTYTFPSCVQAVEASVESATEAINKATAEEQAAQQAAEMAVVAQQQAMAAAAQAAAEQAAAEQAALEAQQAAEAAALAAQQAAEQQAAEAAAAALAAQQAAQQAAEQAAAEIAAAELAAAQAAAEQAAAEQAAIIAAAEAAKAAADKAAAEAALNQAAVEEADAAQQANNANNGAPVDFSLVGVSLQGVSISDRSNKPYFKMSWTGLPAGHSVFGKIFICEGQNCIESKSGEMRFEVTTSNATVEFDRSIASFNNPEVVVTAMDRTRGGEFFEIYRQPHSFACDPNLYKEIHIQPMSGPIDLNCDGTLDITSGSVAIGKLLTVYPHKTTSTNNQEISHNDDGDIVINPSGNARPNKNQSCMYKVVTKPFFNGELDIKLVSRVSQTDSSEYVAPGSFKLSQSDCSRINGEKTCVTTLNLCSSRPNYIPSLGTKKGYDNRRYHVNLIQEGDTISDSVVLRNECQTSFLLNTAGGYNPAVRDGLDNNCDGNIDEAGSFKAYCDSVDRQGNGVCRNRCNEARSEHLVNIFRFKKTCDFYNGSLPNLFSTDVKRESKSLCPTRGVPGGGFSAFENTITSCNACSEGINKVDSAWTRDQSIEDTCTNYSLIQGYLSRAVYTDFSYQPENCAARVECTDWDDSSAADPIYY